MKQTIIRDTREQNFWSFNKSEFVEEVIVTKLESGDYSMVGYEDSFVIERKGSISEWANNIFEKRFINELERLAEFKHPYIFLEFTADDVMKFPRSSDIPKYRWKYLKVTPDIMLRRTWEFSVKYGVHIIFCGNYGQKLALSLFKRIAENGISKSQSCA